MFWWWVWWVCGEDDETAAYWRVVKRGFRAWGLDFDRRRKSDAIEMGELVKMKNEVVIWV